MFNYVDFDIFFEVLNFIKMALLIGTDHAGICDEYEHHDIPPRFAGVIVLDYELI